MSEIRTYVAGIDGGGSKTEALLVDISTGASQRFLSGGINALTDDIAVAKSHLQEIIRDMATYVQRNKGVLQHICLGSPSNFSDAEPDWAVSELVVCFPQARIQGVTDGRIALTGALNGEPGVIVVAGTGSVAYSLDEEGSFRRCGGFGPIFGDEGSGYAMGRDALQAVAMDLDGRGESTLLRERLQQRLSFHNEATLIEKVYSVMSRKQIAALAEVVGMCALEKDPVSLRILDHAAKQLARHYHRLIEQSYWEQPPLLSYAGGVFRMGEMILRPLNNYLGAWAERLALPIQTPVEGAVILAKQAMGDAQ
ncbi:N-acetylglucosamine kinase [Paenibacillus qinlingensis]|uniref:N-acetylglucosamine kinase n=1 Tax=Paenibacillus qinlingensis TaxID=1837343 RepID=UPI001563B0A0|nr:BadF/BadG/BcrA/BcrD ATPase family protein [Paenibacillus qinlingensis]NQX60151.1 hypothetical protein [Paenibacillus qinlingensis]